MSSLSAAKATVLTLAFLLGGLTFSRATENQNGLPECPAVFSAEWNNCFGTHIWPEGGTYVGEWREGAANGRGSFTLPDGEKYVGEYKDGERNGKGTNTWPDGRRYIGNWQGGVANGFGTTIYPDGRTHIGEYKNDARHGKGTYSWPSGATYTGEYEDGKRSGRGTYKYSNGTKYIGVFKDNKRHGPGIEYGLNGLVLKNGLWQNDKFLRPAFVDLSASYEPVSKVHITVTDNTLKTASDPNSAAPIHNSGAFPEPRKVKTIPVRSDGTFAQGTLAVTSAPAPVRPQQVVALPPEPAARPRSEQEASELVRKFHPNDISRLLSKEDAAQRASTGRAVNQTASPGAPNANPSSMSPSLRGALNEFLKEQYKRCWKLPPTPELATPYVPQLEVNYLVSGALAREPKLRNPPTDPSLMPLAESALRAVKTCDPLRVPAQFQPYYSEWKDRILRFDPKSL
jgi:hypothetical protein